jgi:hypothetical protein
MRLELEIISVMARVAGSDPRYELLPDCRIRIKGVLGGLHHDIGWRRSPCEIEHTFCGPHVAHFRILSGFLK